MRLHALQVQAFGPFADRQQVDFDQLAAQGLFLLNGPTGAGKSSVLDAICFALYGSLPGTRQGSKRLRSDHAPDGLPPEVVLEFTAGGRRFLVTRSPQWSRPSKRGTGTTTEQASVLLQELVEEAWVQKSARNDEAGVELREVLGMDREQFTRVVMLPQGEFAAFLRSDAASRRELLQRLFATDRFESIEKALAEKAQRAAAALAEGEAGQQRALRRAEDEAARHGVHPDLEDSTWQAVLATLTRGVSATHASVAQTASQASDRVEELKVAYTRLSGRMDRAGVLGRLRDEQAAHEATRDAAAGLVARIEAHQRACELRGSLQALEHAEAHQMDRRAEWVAAMDAVGESALVPSYLGAEAVEAVGAKETVDTAVLRQASEAAAGELGVLRAALPEEEQLEALRRQQDRLEADGAALDAEATELDAVLEQGREDLALLRADLSSLTAPAAQVTDRTVRLTEARQLEEVITKYAAAIRRSEQVQQEYLRASEQFLALKEQWLTLLQRRLGQAAAELAAKLVPGQPCAVCGSTDHPQPAEGADGDLVTHDQEREAHAKQDAAEARLAESTCDRDAVLLDVARLEARGGSRDAADAATATAAAASSLAEAQSARDSLGRIEVRLAELGALEESRGARRRAIQQRAADVAATRASLTRQHDELVRKLERHRQGFDSLAARAVEVEQARALLDEARSCTEAFTQAQERGAAAAQTLTATLAGTGFADSGQVRAALLSADTFADYQGRRREFDATEDRLEREWKQQDVLTALAEESTVETADESTAAPALTADALTQAERAVLESEQERQRCAVTLLTLEQSLQRLAAHEVSLGELERAVGPLRHEHDLIGAVSESARGGGENLYKMSLGTYVLAARLEQVATAATERLLAMTDGRFALEHSDALAGNRRAGLGLNVLDGWTGQRRDTATLSGGESFMASLAMALGLADVVQQEAGGLDIETLFVDEGFGSLDEQALEQVMDALEGLRSGGRVVGLVSHVAELKHRITDQLQVTRGRHGSTLNYVDLLERIQGG